MEEIEEYFQVKNELPQTLVWGLYRIQVFADEQRACVEPLCPALTAGAGDSSAITDKSRKAPRTGINGNQGSQLGTAGPDHQL